MIPHPPGDAEAQDREDAEKVVENQELRETTDRRRETKESPAPGCGVEENGVPFPFPTAFTATTTIPAS